MKEPFPSTFRTRLRLASRAPVGAWKRWREPRLAHRLKHQLAVCAIFRDEAPFLDEWLNFHTGIGVSHFYLYNNFSTDNFLEVLRPWQAAGLVTLTGWPVQKGQLSAFDDCIQRFKSQARWIAFIDVDEFLFAPQSRDILPVLSSFAHQPGIEVWHVYFGANGHVKRPASPVTEAYTRCALPTTTTVKTIANPRLVYKTGVHQFKFWAGHGADTAGQVAGPPVPPVFDVLRINHYWSRSFEDMQAKFRRGGAATVNKRDYDWYLKFESKLNHKTDLVIQPIARAVQKTVR